MCVYIYIFICVCVYIYIFFFPLDRLLVCALFRPSICVDLNIELAFITPKGLP